MPGLSGRERAGFKKIMGLMTTDDLLSLSDTVTNKMIVVENVREAKETILTFTNNAEELLKRRKVQRDLIFKYLAKEGIPMPPNSDKQQLITRTLELWSSGEASAGSTSRVEMDRTRLQERTEAASSDVKPGVGFDPLVLGHKFCQWFFPLLNSQNPSSSQEPQDWGPQHFWPNVKLSLHSRVGSETVEEFLGAELVSLRLLALSKDELLLFYPNLETNGLKALASPHGLVLVAVAGTIHRGSTCLGIFEQVFGLIRSPLVDNSWKIKFSNLKIKGQDALVGTEATAPSLSYNSRELALLSSE